MMAKPQKRQPRPKKAGAFEVGGGGHTFEVRFGGYLLALLALESYLPSFPSATIRAVRFQVRYITEDIDDQLVELSHPVDGQLSVYVSCKSGLKAQPKQVAFQETFLGLARCVTRAEQDDRTNEFYYIAASRTVESNLQGLIRLLTVARGSRDLDDLLAKLEHENSAVQKALESVKQVLASTEDRILLQVLKRTWIHCFDFTQPVPEDKRRIIERLQRIVPNESETEAKALLDGFDNLAASSALTWGAIDYAKLHGETNGPFRRPIRGDQSASVQSQEYRDGILQNIVELEIKAGGGEWWETYLETCSLRERIEPVLLAAEQGQSRAELERLFARILRLEGRAILVMSLELHGRDWIRRARIVADQHTNLWPLIGRIGLLLNSELDVQESLERIALPNELLLFRARQAEEAGQLDEALGLMQQVPRTDNPEAMTLYISIQVGRLYTGSPTMQELLGEARKLLDSGVGGPFAVIAAAGALSACIASDASPAYAMPYDAESLDIPGILRIAKEACDQMGTQQLGSFERLVLARVMKQLTPAFSTIVALPNVFEPVPAYLEFTDSPHAFAYLQLATELGAKVAGLQVINWLRQRTDHDPQILDAFEAALGGEADTRDAAVVGQPVSAQQEANFDLARLVRCMQVCDDSEIEALAAGIIEKWPHFSVSHVARFCLAARAGRFEDAQAVIMALLGELPDAVESYAIIGQLARRWLQETHTLIASSDEPDTELERHFESLVSIAFVISAHLAIRYRAEDHLVRCFELSTQSKSKALAQLCNGMAHSLDSTLSDLTEALVFQQDARFEEAVDSFERYFENHEPTPSMRKVYDYCRLWAGQYAQLLRDEPQLWTITSRLPDHAAVYIEACRRSGDANRAYTISERNFAQFPEDRNAWKLWIMAGIGSGHEDVAVPAMMQYIEKYPDDRELWLKKIEPGVHPFEEYKRAAVERHQCYVKGMLPITLLPGDLGTTWLRYQAHPAGIQVRRHNIRGNDIRAHAVKEVPLFLEQTAILSIEQYGLWDLALREHVPLFVSRTTLLLFEQELAMLESKLSGPRLHEAKLADQMLAHGGFGHEALTEEEAKQLSDRPTLGEENDLLVKSRGLTETSFLRESKLPTPLDVLECARRLGRCTPSEYQSLKAAAINGEDNPICRVEVEAVPEAVVFDPEVLIRIADAGFLELLFRTFPRVVITPIIRERFIGQFSEILLEDRARMLLRGTVSSLGDLINRGSMALLDSQAHEPKGIAYLLQELDVARNASAVLWSDDAWTRCLAASELNLPSLSTPEFVTINLGDSETAKQTLDQLAMDGYRDVGDDQLLARAALAPYRSDERVERLVRRFAYSLHPDFARSPEEVMYYRTYIAGQIRSLALALKPDEREVFGTVVKRFAPFDLDETFWTVVSEGLADLDGGRDQWLEGVRHEL